MAMILYIIILFVLLSPGILITLPPKGSKLLVAITHALLFALILHLTHNLVQRLEAFNDTPITASANIIQPCKNGTSGANGTCLTCYTGYMLNDNNMCVSILR